MPKALVETLLADKGKPKQYSVFKMLLFLLNQESLGITCLAKHF